MKPFPPPDQAAPRDAPPPLERYLDANATTGCSASVARAVADTMLGGPLNPASGHSTGARARDLCARSRDAVAALLGCQAPEDIVFTSGGTEANNLALAARPWDDRLTIVVSAVEHASVLKVAEEAMRRGADLRVLPVNGDGLVSVLDVERALTEARENVLVSIQWANGETGVVQPLASLMAAAAKVPGSFRHTDAVQACGRIPVDIHACDLHALSISAHKIHGPAGIGALVLADADGSDLRPIQYGGEQQRGIRPGTEPTPLIVGMGVAARERFEDLAGHAVRMALIRDLFEAAVTGAIPAVTVNGVAAPRLPNTSNLRFPDVDGAALVAHLDAQGIRCSQGSACSNGSPHPSHVLLAMGLTQSEAYASLRFSFSIANNEEEALEAAEIVARTAAALRGRSPW